MKLAVSFSLCVYSAAIIIKEERLKDGKYGFSDFIRSRKNGEPKLMVPSSLSEAVKRLATDDDLKVVGHIVHKVE